MHTLFQDLRYAVRKLSNDPGFTIVAVLTLALGIGANTAIFSVVNAVLLRPLPYADASRVVMLLEQTKDYPRFTVSYLNYADWRDQSHSYEAVGAVRNTIVTMTGSGEPERLPSQNATANLFGVLGISPEVGRPFSAEEDRAGAANVVLISHGLWQRRFASSRDVVGKAITLDDKPYTIIGVLPAGYQILQQIPDVVMPFEPWARTLPNDRAWHPGILPIARLKKDVTLEQARTELTLIAKRLEKQYPVYNTGTGSYVNPIQEQVVENVRPALLVLMGAVGFVLLIACTNVANLLLARATGRQREIAVRTALGASHARVIRQLLTESVLLAVVGGILGLIFAWLSMPPLLQLAGSSLPLKNRVSIDLWVLGFTALVAPIAGILFGLVPARHTWRLDLRDALSETERGGATRGMLQLRSFFVVAEVAVAVLLMVGAGLLLRSFDRLTNVAPGFSTDHMLVADIPLSANARRTPTERLDFYENVLQQSAALPGVKTAAAASFLPVSGAGMTLYFNIQGRPPKGNDYAVTNYRAVTTNYFSVLQIPLLQGRLLEPTDREGAPPVVVVNSTMARTFFPDQSPLGQHIQIGGLPNAVNPWMEIVGVVGDVKQALASEAPIEIYLPYRQADRIRPVLFLSLVVRTEGAPQALAESVRKTVFRIDPNQPVAKVRTMEENVSDSVAQPRFRTVLLAIFAGLALVLSTLGIFSVMAYSVAQRAREIGVRVALGATRTRILQLILGYSMRLTVIGLVLGIAATFIFTRYVSSFLFKVPSHDPMTLAAIVVVVFLVSTLACYIPAHRATRVNPINALRQD